MTTRLYRRTRHLEAEIARLEAEVDDLTDRLAHATARAYHSPACPVWRGQECACGLPPRVDAEEYELDTTIYKAAG